MGAYRILYHDAACTKPAALGTTDKPGLHLCDLTEYGAKVADLLAQAPAMAEALRYFRPVLANHIGQEVSVSELADLDRLLAKVEGLALT